MNTRGRLRSYFFAAVLLACVGIVAEANGAVLVGRWTLDEGTGQVANDSSGSGLHGVLGSTSAVEAADPQWTPALFGNALAFSGGDRVSIPASPLLTPATVSVTAWVRRSGTPGRYQYIVSKGGLDCLASSYGLYTGDGGAAFYILKYGQREFVKSPEADQSIWDGRWHHLAGTYDGQRVRMYVDGVEIGRGTRTTTPIHYATTESGTFIGAYRGSCDLGFRGGNIDEVEIWDGALTPSEIAAEAARRPETIPPGQDVPPPSTTVPGTLPTSTAPTTLGSLSTSATPSALCPRVSITPTPTRLTVGKRSRILVSTTSPTTVRVLVTMPGIRRAVWVRPGRATPLVIRPTKAGIIRTQVVEVPRPQITASPKRVAANRRTTVVIRPVRLSSRASVVVEVRAPGQVKRARVHRGQITRVEVRSPKAGKVVATVVPMCRTSNVGRVLPRR